MCCGCPYCTSKILCEDDSCKICFEKSFASHPRSSFFSKKNIDIIPRNIIKGSGCKYWFDCGKGHIFESSLTNLTSRNGRPGSWCPYCVHKTEEILYNRLVEYYPTIQRQFRVEWCKKKNYLPFDNVIPEYKIIIELDGPQHFRQIYKGGRTPDEERENDKYKMNCANENGYSVIRILQEDVYYNIYDWIDELIKSIQSVITDDVIQNIFLYMNDEYDSY
jgi:very-short-patch-repair endonuclease